MLSQIQQKSDGTQSIEISAYYDKNGNKRETDGNDNSTEHIYDALNRITETKITASGILHSTVYGYDANSNQTTVADWRGNTSENIYDPLNRVIEKKDPYGTIQKLEYYKNNLQSKSYDALDKCTQFSYDRNGRLLSTTDPEGDITSQAYDDAGNVLTKTDGRNISTTYKYDEFNRLKSVINAKGEVTGYTYDTNGNMRTQTDGNGNTTMFEYNVANKLVRKIDANGTDKPEKTESYTYFADGTLKTKTDRNGKTTDYSYDIHGRLLSQTIDGSTISYTYDNNSNQLTMTDSTGTTTRTYDEFNRVLTKQVPNMGTMSFSYDITSGVEAGCTGEQTTDPKGNVTLKIFDKVGRLYNVTASGGTTVYTYYATGSRKSVSYPNGAKEEYTYYNDGLLKELKNIKANGTVMDVYTYTYDDAHNQLTKHEVVNGVDKGTTSYTYDSLNRLETVTEPGKTTSYTFDKAGNRLSETVNAGEQTVVTTYSYNDQNRLFKTITQNGTETERIVYKYDNNGNMLAKERTVSTNVPSGDNPGVKGSILGQSVENYGTIYRYDVWNQLTKTIEKDKTVTYAYNGEGYMVEKDVNGSLTRLLYESDKVVLETDAAGTQTGRNIYGLNLLSRTMDSATAYYMYNGHADVTALLSSDGLILASYRYDAWGTAIEKNETPNIDNPYRYAGYRYEVEADLYYLNARYYDSKIARFLTEDTYRGSAADPLSLNLYTYCVNNPLRYWDPTGHEMVTKTWEGYVVTVDSEDPLFANWAIFTEDAYADTMSIDNNATVDTINVADGFTTNISNKGSIGTINTGSDSTMNLTNNGTVAIINSGDDSRTTIDNNGIIGVFNTGAKSTNEINSDDGFIGIVNTGLNNHTAIDSGATGCNIGYVGGNGTISINGIVYSQLKWNGSRSGSGNGDNLDLFIKYKDDCIKILTEMYIYETLYKYGTKVYENDKRMLEIMKLEMYLRAKCEVNGIEVTMGMLYGETRDPFEVALEIYSAKAMGELLWMSNPYFQKGPIVPETDYNKVSQGTGNAELNLSRNITKT